MDNPKRSIWHLMLGISALSVLGWFVNSYIPDTFLHFTFFFLIIAVTTFLFSLFLFKIVRRAVLITIGVIVWLALRLLGLRDWYFPALLVPVLISLEILFQKR